MKSDDDDDDDDDDEDDADDDDDDDAEYKVHDHRRFRVVRLGEAGLVMTGSVEGGGGISTKGELISGQDHHVGNGDGDDHDDHNH